MTPFDTPAECRPARECTAESRFRLAGRRWRPILLALVLLLLALVVPEPAHAETLSVPELNEKIEQWRVGRKVPPPVRYQIEGRAIPTGRHRLQFRGCTVPFESKAELSEPTRRNANREVTGMVVRNEETGMYSFQIESVRELPSDLETYFERRRELRREAPEKWYELGKWAARRGEFYNDHELLVRSEEAFAHALDLERQALSRENPEGLLALAEKAHRLHLPEKLSQELLHEGVSILWRNSRRQTGSDLDSLLALLVGRLPGATEPLSEPQDELQKAYFESPRETYLAADPPTRRILHRLLYADVLLRTITPELASDGSNGFAVAKKLEGEIPEQHALAETFRDKALAARAKGVESLPKSELLALAQEYRDRQQSESADHLIESWLMLRQRRLEPDDTEGLIELTDEYRNLLKRNDRADRLLIDAWKKNPKSIDLARRLQQAGYRLFEQTWMTAAEYNARPEGKLEQAIRTGRIEAGMTSGNVRRSLGEPQRMARAATSGVITEVWTYESAGTTGLTVRLKRNRRQSELTVVDVAQTEKDPR
jgi:hypothetical protein